MSSQSPLDHFLDKVEELMQKVKNSEFSEDEVPVELIENLNLLENVVETMVNANDATLKSLGINDPHIQQALETKEGLSQTDRRALERMERIKKETQEMQKEFAMATKLNKRLKKESGKSKTIARQKKFRRLGGRSDWTPL